MLIAQITDTHIVEKNQHWLAEPLTETDKRLSRVIAHLSQMDPVPDLILLSGDVTDEGSVEAYYHFQELLSSLKISLYLIPGNHDRREEMRQTFAREPYMPAKGFIQYVVDHYPVRLIALDTLVEGENYGMLCEERFSYLERMLEEEKKKPTLIWMHHPPAKTGTTLFDRMACLVPPTFERLIQEKSNLLGTLAGHYHHLCVTSFGGKPCFIAPSVAPAHYFAHPQDEEVTALELEDPAITLHHWQEGERLTSHVLRIKTEIKRLDWKQIKRNMARAL